MYFGKLGTKYQLKSSSLSVHTVQGSLVPMPRSKHRKKLKSSSGPNRARQSLERGVKPIYVEKLSLSEINYSDRVSLLVELGQDAAERFSECEAKLLELAERLNPVLLLANISYICLTDWNASTGRTKPRAHREYSPPIQGHVELFQAFSLRFSSSTDSPPPSPDDIQEVLDALQDVVRYEQTSHLSKIGSYSEDEKKLEFLRQRIKQHTLIVRNWGYLPHVKNIMRELYLDLEADFLASHKIALSDVFRIFEYMVGITETKLTDFVNRQRHALAQPKRRAMVRNYCAEFQIENQFEELWEYVQNNRLSRNQITAILMHHSSLWLPDVFLFELGPISESLGIEESVVQSVLVELSLKFGDLREQELGHFYYQNPVWDKPIIHIGDSTFFCPIPMILYGRSLTITDRLLTSAQISEQKLNRTRSVYLETKTLRLLKDFLPNAEFDSNVSWTFRGQGFETDLLMRVDTQLFIIEAKSGRVSQPALRGGLKRIEKHIRELLFSPAEQSARLERCLKGVDNDESFEITTRIDLSGVLATHRLSVTLEDFAAIQSNLSYLDYSNSETSQSKLPMTVSLSDLMVIGEILEKPWAILHYLIRRQDIQHRVKYVGDEIDLLGLYLRTGFNLSDFEDTGDVLLATGMSKDIDDYYQLRQIDSETHKPKQQMTKWFASIISGLYERGPKGWTEIAILLLDMSIEQQRDAEKWFRKIVAKVSKSKADIEKLQNVLVVQLDGAHRSLYAFVAIRPIEYSDRHRIMENAAIAAFDGAERDSCVVIALNTERAHQPYSSLGLFHNDN